MLSVTVDSDSLDDDRSGKTAAELRETVACGWRQKVPHPAG
ncbi:hypothetical protein EKH55_5294 [Sinorhizobium alkalisoli]|nr:hypothetical protein EKH55_5294 [Sinorhizobium alkalisoli]